MNRWSCPFRALALLAALAAPLAAQIDVPGDYPDPQTAIDNASPGDVIVIHGGTWGPLVIDKALTLVGDPRPFLVGEAPPGSGYQDPPIELAGPGSGEVVLVNLETGGTVNGIYYSATFGGVHGGGFAELHVHDSSIAAPEWVALTGIGIGAPGIDVTVPYVLVAGSSVTASDGADDGCYFFVPDGQPAILATASTVVVLDSTVQGGSYRNPCVPGTNCPGASGGMGGDGIVADKVVEANSTIQAGAGAVWHDEFGAYCTTMPDGTPVVTATHQVLANDLVASGPALLGGTFTLTWDTPGPVASLYWSRGPYPPFTLIAGLPEAHLDPASAKLLANLPAGGGPQSRTFPVPVASGLIGLELAFQAFDSPDVVTRPVVTVLRP